MASITIHGFAPSTYTRSARMAALELGLEYELTPIAYGQPEHLALHPFGKMPVLTSGKAKVFETLAIMTWLDETSGRGSLFGSDSRERVDTLELVSVAIDYAYRAIVHIDLKDGVPDDDQTKAAARVLDWLELRLVGRAFLTGKALTAADLFLAPMVAYHARQVGDGPTYSSRPNLDRWMTEMSGRRSFQETV